MARIIRKGDGANVPLDFGVPPGYTIYLSGGMEYSSDYGMGWRDKIVQELSETGFKFYNPCEEEKPILKHHGVKDPTELFKMKTWKDLPKAVSVVKDFLIKDRNVIYQCNALIVYYDKSTQLGGGTAMEQAWANEGVNEQRPIFFVMGIGFELKNVSLSMLAMSDYIFEDLKDCIIYLKRARELYDHVT